MANALNGSKNNSEVCETLESLEQTLREKITGTIVIRPKVVFQLVEKIFTEIPIYSLPLPSSQIGSVTTLESSIICSILAIKKPRIIFEFGTFLGFTTSTIFRNMSAESTLYSLDLPSESTFSTIESKLIDWELIKSNDAYNDQFLTRLAKVSGETYLNGYHDHPKLQLLKQNSLLFNPNEFDLIGKTDFIFLDGGHTDEIVRSDTRKSFDMLSDSGVLIWHDYNSQIHGKVTEVVNEVAKERIVITVQNTMLALTSNDFNLLLSTSDPTR